MYIPFASHGQKLKLDQLIFLFFLIGMDYLILSQSGSFSQIVISVSCAILHAFVY